MVLREKWHLQYHVNYTKPQVSQIYPLYLLLISWHCSIWSFPGQQCLYFWGILSLQIDPPCFACPGATNPDSWHCYQIDKNCAHQHTSFLLLFFGRGGMYLIFLHWAVADVVSFFPQLKHVMWLMSFSDFSFFVNSANTISVFPYLWCYLSHPHLLLSPRHLAECVDDVHSLFQWPRDMIGSHKHVLCKGTFKFPMSQPIYPR